MKSKLLAVLMVVLLLGMTLAACGGNEPAAEKESAGGGGAPVEKTADDSESAEEPESKTEDSDAEDSKGKNGIDPTKKVKTSKDGKLKIVDKGYSYGEGEVSAVAILGNYNSEDAYDYTTVTVTAYDDDESVLGTSEAYVTFIQPGEVQAAYTTVETNGKKPEKVDFELNEGDEANVDENKVPSYQIVAMNCSEQVVDKEMNWTKITGQIENKSSNDIDDVELVLVLRKKGEMVYLDSSTLSNVKGKKKKAFEVELLEGAPKYDSIQVYTSDESM